MECQYKLSVLQFNFEKFLAYQQTIYKKTTYVDNIFNIAKGNYEKIETPFEKAWRLYNERVYEKKYEFETITNCFGSEFYMPLYYQKGNKKGQQKFKILSHYKIPRTRWQHKNDFLDQFYEWVDIPCGKCEMCKMNNANEWATKAWMEMKYHEKSCFLTLTYDNKHLPHVNGTKNKKATLEPKKEVWTPFMKCLRDHYGEGLKFLMCGEYGPQTKRPHYHAIIFGMFPDDAELEAKRSASGHIMFHSDWIEKHWGKGIVKVGIANAKSACYVAQYTTKKLSKNETVGKGRVEEYIHASNRPGLGTTYWLENLDNILENNAILYNGFTHQIPRTFLRRLEREDPLRAYLHKIRTIQKIQQNQLFKEDTDLSEFEQKINNIQKFEESARQRIRNNL